MQVISMRRHLSGGSPFIPVGDNRYLALTHHSYLGSKGRIYVHHFTIISIKEEWGGQRTFTVDWVSDAFRCGLLWGFAFVGARPKSSNSGGEARWTLVAGCAG